MVNTIELQKNQDKRRRTEDIGRVRSIEKQTTDQRPQSDYPRPPTNNQQKTNNRIFPPQALHFKEITLHLHPDLSKEGMFNLSVGEC